MGKTSKAQEILEGTKVTLLNRIKELEMRLGKKHDPKLDKQPVDYLRRFYDSLKAEAYKKEVI